MAGQALDMNGLVAVLAFIVTLGILVTVHEYGHYWVAKRCGIKVLTFSIGFGKAIYRWQRGETIWQLGSIPLGGYVRMLDEREGSVPAADLDRAFNRQHPLKKMAVVVAGPAANLILALLFYWVLFMAGVTTLTPEIADVTANSPASHVGIHRGDRVTRIADTPVRTYDDIQSGMLDAASKGVPFDIYVLRNDQSVTVHIDPVATGISNVDADTLDRFGISPARILPVVSQVEPGSAAAVAGLKAGDQLLTLDNIPLSSWSQLPARLIKDPASPVHLTLRRNGEVQSMVIQPRLITEKGKQIGRLGVVGTRDDAAWARQITQLRYGPIEAFGEAVNQAWNTIRLNGVLFGRMITGHVSASQVGGPLTIAKMAGQSAQAGLEPFIDTLAVISLSLAILNLLPVPLLDGGHLMYHAAELLTGRPVSATVEAVGMRLGLLFLAGLMALALYNDFYRLITG